MQLLYDLYKIFFPSTPTHIAIYNFILINAGIAFLFLTDLVMRSKSSPRTPRKFSLSFLFWDNLERILMTALCMFITWVFMPEIQLITGAIIPENLNRLTPFVLGIMNDGLPLLIKNYFIKNKK